MPRHASHCVYCSKPCENGSTTCMGHRDLPALDPELAPAVHRVVSEHELGVVRDPLDVPMREGRRELY